MLAQLTPPPADSPQSSLNPFPTETAPPAKKRTRRLSSGSDAQPRPPHHTRNERRKANRGLETARQVAPLGASPNPIPIASSSSTSATSAPSTIPIPEADIGVRGGASYLKTPAEKRHASATSLSQPPTAGKASRTADPSLSPAESQAETLTPTGTAQPSPTRAPFTYLPVPGLDRRAQFNNQIVQAAIHALRPETDQLEVHLTLRPVPVDTFDVCGSEGQEGYWTPRVLEYLALLRKAVPAEILKWTDLHQIHIRWTQASPMPPAYGLQIFLNNHCDPLPPKAIHPLQRVREIYWADPVDAATGPLHLIVEGPANVPGVVALLYKMVQRWGTDDGVQAVPLVVGGPEWTQRAYGHLGNVYGDLNLPSLYREAFTDALAHDPCHLLRGSSKPILRPSKSARKLEQLIREHDPHIDPAHFGLRPLLAEYGSPEIDRIPQVDLLEVLKREMDRDQSPNPMQILALLDPGPLRTAALRCLQEFVQAELLPHLEPLATGATPQ